MSLKKITDQYINQRYVINCWRVSLFQIDFPFMFANLNLAKFLFFHEKFVRENIVKILSMVSFSFCTCLHEINSEKVHFMQLFSFAMQQKMKMKDLPSFFRENKKWC